MEIIQLAANAVGNEETKIRPLNYDGNYVCPTCNNYVTMGERYCGSCKTRFDWSFLIHIQMF